MEMLDIILAECEIITDEDQYLAVSIPPQFLRACGGLIFAGLIMLPINSAFMSMVHKPNKIFQFAHWAILALLAILSLTYNAIRANLLTGGWYSPTKSLLQDEVNLYAAFNTLFFVVATYIMILLSVWLNRMQNGQVSKGVRMILNTATAVSAQLTPYRLSRS
jgi:hypothetical protein